MEEYGVTKKEIRVLGSPGTSQKSKTYEMNQKQEIEFLALFLAAQNLKTTVCASIASFQKTQIFLFLPFRCFFSQCTAVSSSSHALLIQLVLSKSNPPNQSMLCLPDT
jgi:hypothetical protein